MTDPAEMPAPPAPPSPPGAPKRRLPWLKIVLVVSLAFNLLIAGLVAGAMLGGPHLRDRDRPPSALRDLGFGPFVAALPERDRRAMGAALVRDAGSFRENRAEMRRHFEALLAGLRADPYDAPAVRRLVAAQQAKVTERQALGQHLILERIEAMSVAERAAYADRLDRAIRRGPRPERR